MLLIPDQVTPPIQYHPYYYGIIYYTAKIYVSPETLKKLSESDDYSKILNRFEINHPEPKKQQSKPSTSNHANKNEKNEKELRRSLKLLKRKLRKIRQRHHIKLQNNNAPKKKKKSPTKPLMGDISKRQHSRVINQPVTFFYTPRKSSPRPSSSKSSGKKAPVSSKYMFDHSSPANEYESRQVEFGHGRAKSKEWNDEVAREFQKELKQNHKQKPDWTDRFALK